MSAPDRPARRRWAQLRFSIIGPLLAAPPEHGDLRAALEELAAKRYKHPTTGEAMRFGVSTIERWLYCARGTTDPVAALARKIPSPAGSFPAMPARLAAALEVQWRQGCSAASAGLCIATAQPAEFVLLHPPRRPALSRRFTTTPWMGSLSSLRSTNSPG